MGFLEVLMGSALIVPYFALNETIIIEKLTYEIGEFCSGMHNDVQNVTSSIDYCISGRHTHRMPDPIHPYAIYNSKQAASLLGVDIITIQRYIRSGKLSATKLGKVYRITGQSLIELMSLDSNSVSTLQGRVRKIEIANYTKSQTYLSSNQQGQKYLTLFDLTSNTLISYLEPSDKNTEDEKTIKYIGTRVFNSSMAAFRDALSGYYQVSFSNQRDLIEIQFLMDYFRTEPKKINEWRIADNKARIENFSPGKVRKYLDDRDGYKQRKREIRYKQFCELAAHVTYPGFKLILNKENHIEIGAFYDEFKLLNTMHELCFNFGHVVISMCANLPTPNTNAAMLSIKHMEVFDQTFNLNTTKSLKFQKAKEHLDSLIKQLIQVRNE